MTGRVRSFRSLYARVSLGLLGLTLGAAGQQTHPQKAPLLQMFAVQPDGSAAQLIGETAAIDLEQVRPTTNGANAQNTLTLARLPGGKAKVRYLAGQEVRIIVLLSTSVDPIKIELQPFESRGEIRVAYLGPFRSREGVNPNALPFRARLAKDGRWLFEPGSKLDAGEYCFSPKFNNDNFCFGVDKK